MLIRQYFWWYLGLLALQCAYLGRSHGAGVWRLPLLRSPHWERLLLRHVPGEQWVSHAGFGFSFVCIISCVCKHSVIFWCVLQGLAAVSLAQSGRDRWQTQNRWIVMTLMLSSWMFLRCELEMTFFYICPHIWKPKSNSIQNVALQIISLKVSKCVETSSEMWLPLINKFSIWPFPKTDAFLSAAGSRRPWGVLSN